MSADDIIRKGHAAKAMLENPDFIIAVDAVRLSAFKGWAGTLPPNSAEREENYYLLLAVDKLKATLQALADGARFEEHKAERDEPKPQPKGESDD